MPLSTGMHGRAEQLHHVDVERLPFDVDRAHVDVDRHAELRTDGRGRDAVLTGAGFRDDARLAHAPREQRLTDGVVDLMRARVIEIFALEQQRRGAADRRAVRRGTPATAGRRSRASTAWYSRQNAGSANASFIAASSCAIASISTSGTNVPPKVSEISAGIRLACIRWLPYGAHERAHFRSDLCIRLVSTPLRTSTANGRTARTHAPRCRA